MCNDTIIELKILASSKVKDALAELLSQGTVELIATAVQAELEEFLTQVYRSPAI